MVKWRCSVCGYIYNPKVGDPESGINSGVIFNELPDRWGCPDCGADKNLFERYEDYEEHFQTEQ